MKRNKQQKEAYDAAWRIIRGETQFENEFDRVKQQEARTNSEDAKSKSKNAKS